MMHAYRTPASPCFDRKRVLRKTGEDGEFAGELPEVTNEAHSKSAKDSEHSVDEAQPGSQSPTKNRESEPRSEVEAARPLQASPREFAAGGPGPGELAPAENAERAAAENAELAAAENDASAVSAGTAEAAEISAAARGTVAPASKSTQRGEPLVAARSREAERELDFAEADRFAASIRPSWSDAPPVPVSRPPVQIVGAAGGARVVRHNTRTDLNLPLRKRRGSAYTILGASLLGMFGLLYLGVASSTIDHGSQSRGLGGQRPASKPSEPVETTLHAAKRPEPVPTAQNEPQLSAAQPSEPSAPLPSVENEPQAIDPEPALGEPEVKEPGFVAEEARDPSSALAAPAEPSAAPEPAAEPAAPPALAAAPAGPSPNENEKDLQPAAAAAPLAAAQKLETVRATDRGKLLLNVAAYPPNTRLRVNGALVENPYRARVSKSSKLWIDAAAPGFAPESHVLRMEADVQLMMSLKRDHVRDVKADPYRDQRRAAAASVSAPQPKRNRGAGFVAENPY